MKKKSSISKTTDHRRQTTGQKTSLVVRSLLSYCQSLNLRALIGLFVILAGVFLALISFGPATTGFAQGTTREQMTLSLAQAAGVFEPPACVPGQEMFTDVPASSPFCPWIEELVRRGITSGCTPTQYCPSASVTRAQMAPFLLKATGWLAITDPGNTAVGDQALFSNATGEDNTATGFQALFSNTIGLDNTAIGVSALSSNTEGESNTAIGSNALLNSTGSANTAIGYLAGSNLTNGGDNICIDNVGVAGESNTTRIGTNGIQSRTFIAGISGVTVSGGAAVFIKSDGQLGTSTSSRRFKEEIKPMEKASEVLFALKPVSFRYKKEIDPQGIPQFGLVAEDVEAVDPDLVVRDKEGKPYSVRYDQMNAMLLNEFLKEHRKVEAQESKIEKQEAIINELRSTVAEQQKGMEVLTVQLKEQAAQIQKVSAQLAMASPSGGGLEMSRSVARTVLNDR